MKYWDIIWAGKLLYPGVNTNCNIKPQYGVKAESVLNQMPPPTSTNTTAGIFDSFVSLSLDLYPLTVQK